MKRLALAAVAILASTIPVAGADEISGECAAEDGRRVRCERDVASTGQATAAVQPATGDARAQPERARRRSGKPIPDAELIGRRRAL